MGGCLSKKKDALEKKQIKKEQQQRDEKRQSPEKSKKKKQVFANARACNAASSCDGNPARDAVAGKEEDTTKRDQDAPRKPEAATAALEEEQRPFPVRTSSCTKEEVEAILIQCGRLSRSSSGKQASEETGGSARRRSGAKRSYDFDERRRAHEEEDGGDWGRPALRVSPRRRTRDRSGSRERIGGGRRASRSPARRVPPPDSPQFDNLNQPVKMVSVPPREKGAGGDSKAASTSTQTMVQSSSSSLVAGRRGGASPRSRSPANLADASIDGRRAPQHSSRSSGRSTADNSPFRRNPMGNG